MGTSLLSITPCIDHDSNLAFNRPSDWQLEIQADGTGPTVLWVLSPEAPDGSPGVAVALVSECHEFTNLDGFVDDKLRGPPEISVLRGRTNGRHPATQSPAVSVTYDEDGSDGPVRVDMLFVEARPGIILYATAMSPWATRRLWRDGCKVIFGSLRVADPRRPPVSGGERVLGLGLPPGCSGAMKHLWLLLDRTAKRIFDECGRVLEEQTGKSLGVAAHFEARALLLFELLQSMLVTDYGGPQRNQVFKICTYAISGSYPSDTPTKDGPLARQSERLSTYLLADKGDAQPVSMDRTMLFADLVTTSGMGNVPTAIQPTKVYKQRDAFTPEKACICRVQPPLSRPFVKSAVFLFRDTPDIDALDVAEVDRRFNAGHADATRFLDEWNRSSVSGQR